MGINNINIYPKAKHNLSMINTADRPYLNWLTSGVKKAKGRVNSLKYRSMQVGDTILFCDKKNRLLYIRKNKV